MHRILLIDDTPEIAELLSFALRDRGYQVATTGFTTSVNDLIDQQQPTAMVIDCSVYTMSESIFDMVRAQAEHAALPIVIVSDTPEEADASLRARHAEHVLLIPKPFTGSQVARALDELISRQSTVDSRQSTADA
jgi:DNA-binding response OmpR family regulator